MATTTQDTNRAKFLELRQAGKSVAEARNATYGPPPVVADQTPAPVIPVTPAPITNQEVQMGVNAVGGTAEQRRETRANITAGQTIAPPPAPTSVPTRTPETPVETHPPVQGDTAPVTPKVDATPGITQDAFQQAKIESEKIKAQNDAVMAQNQQKSELARQDEAMKAEALIPKNEKDVLNALISGISVPKQNTQAYRNAELKANNYRKYASMTPTQLLDNMKMGEISSEMDQLLASNPNYAQAKQKLNEFQKTQNLNKTMSNIVNGMKGKEVATVTPEQDEVSISDQLMKKYGLDDANASAFAQFVATDEEMAENKAKLLANKNALSSVNRQINETTTLLNQGIKDLKAQYPDMSASGIITLMGSRLGEFNDAITNLNSTKTLLTADIKDEMDLAKSAFDARSEDIKAQNQIRQSMALNEYKSDFEKQQAESALNDPATSISSVIKEFTDMGIPTTQSLQTKIADAQKFIAQGGTLAGYVDKMRSDYMNKPEYKALSEYNKRKLAPESTNYSFANVGDGRIAVQNPKTGQVTYTSAGSVSSANAPTTTSAKYLDIATGTDVGVQCGTFARQLCGLDATPGGNSLEAREKAFSDSAPTAGGMILFTGSGYDKTYGHIASIESVNQDGTLNIVESNLKGDNKVTRRTIQANDPAISGFYNNTPLAKSAGIQASGTQYTDQNINDLAYLVELQEKNPTQAAKDMKELGYTARDLANYKAGNVPMTEKQKNSSTEVMNAIKDLADPSKYEWNDAVGFLAGTPSWSGGDAANATMAIDNLVAKLTLPNLGILKGPMSDKDIQFIKEASSKLSRNQSDASFERNLIDAYNLSARRAGMPEITKLSDISSGTPKQTAGGELDYSKYE